MADDGRSSASRARSLRKRAGSRNPRRPKTWAATSRPPVRRNPPGATRHGRSADPPGDSRPRTHPRADSVGAQFLEDPRGQHDSLRVGVIEDFHAACIDTPARLHGGLQRPHGRGIRVQEDLEAPGERRVPAPTTPGGDSPARATGPPRDLLALMTNGPPGPCTVRRQRWNAVPGEASQGIDG